MIYLRMTIQELIHLHALLLEVRTYLEREGMASASGFEGYDAQPVRPTHIHRRKEGHEKAIFLLVDDIVQSIQRNPPPERAVQS